MYAVEREINRPNRLLQGLVLFSLGVHVILFMHISGIYRSKALTYIELSMFDASKPETRAIPRPALRPRTTDVPQEVKTIQINHPIPAFKQINVDPAGDNSAKGLMEGISVPAVDSTITGADSNYRIADFLGNDVEFESANNYFEMVILRIESVKKYPEEARVMQQEGQVTVEFVVTLSGTVRDIRVIKPCRHNILNDAAIRAVESAVPFPKPPGRFFKEDVPLSLNIIFETT